MFNVTIFSCPYCIHPIFKHPLHDAVFEIPSIMNGFIASPHACAVTEAERAHLERCALRECIK